MKRKQLTNQQKIWFWVLVLFLLFGFLYLIRGILLPFIMGIFIAYFLDPAADKLEKWGCSRSVASGLITLGFFSIFVIGLAALTPTLIDQLSGLIQDLPTYIEQGRAWIQGKVEQLTVMPMLKGSNFNEIGQQVVTSMHLENWGVRILQSWLVLINLLSLLVITPVVAYYLLKEWDVMVARVNQLLPLRYADTIREQMRLIDRSLSGFLRGQFTVMLVLGTFYAIALSLVGLKYGFVIGILAGLLIIIPYLGTTIGGITSVGVALIQFEGYTMPGVVLAIFVLGQVMEGYVLTPKLVGDRVGLHPLWIMFGVLCGGALFGFVGILIALPVTAVIGGAGALCHQPLPAKPILFGT